MRATLLLSTLLVTVASAAQTDSLVRRCEIGADMSAFVRVFISHYAGQDPSIYEQPNYLLSYRYHFREYNLRFGVGGVVDDEEREATWYGAQPGETYHDRTTLMTLRLGVERYEELSRRWQVFYGLDFRPSWERLDDGFTHSNAGYRHARHTREQQMGVAALMGVRFRITPRFSLLTETSFAYVRTDVETRTVSTPQDDTYPFIDDEVFKGTNLNTVFQAPLMLVAAFDL